ncbi:translation machinery-associated protein 16 isoform X2 [Phymastichus coffea]|nr:translation machinery-associated protein 16 isoform X2 [Phymastichus coffea]XP_058810738.1 translation machinery-associated protein 16 isoform X2 [Phymastichus coffea]XP_058810739.1 translation machinery-associated protein 16 isoform X2 [Phymastichus coffea]XP_058810740.1 translation machinery-associated protein 16 isoform X2 [Phymastichus coffea]
MVAASNKFLHPKSRKCVAMVKKVRKESKKEQHKKDYKLKQSLIADKLLWFQKHIDPDICPYTVELTAELIEQYIARNNEELEQIKIKRSIGNKRNKQHIGREDAICMTKKRETSDYETCGFEIPDILNKVHCEMLMKWNGDIKLLPNFKFIHFSKKRAKAVKVKSNINVAVENINGTLKNKSKNVPEVIKDETNSSHINIPKNDEGMETE